MKLLVDEIDPATGDTATDELSARIEKLDTNDALHCAQSIMDALAYQDDLRQHGAGRFKLLEACVVALKQVGNPGEGPAPITPMPLDPGRFSIVTRLLEALELLETEYGAVIDVLSDGVENDDPKRQYQEAWCLYRQLELLDTALISCARVYLPAPELLWTRTHTVVNRAMELGALDFTPVETSDAPGLGDLYAQMLLTALADPYRMTSRQLAAVRSFVRETVGGAEFRTPAHYAETNAKRRYLFAIDFDLDVGALPWRASATPGESEFELVLDVSRLVRLARKRQLAIRNAPDVSDSLINPAAGLGFNRRSGEALYKHLVVEWGKQPIRKSQRRADQRSYDCLIGFDAMQQVHRIDFSDPDDGVEEIVLSGGVDDSFAAVEVSELAPEDAGVVAGVSVDISATGIRLIISSLANPALRIGELIGWCDAASDNGVWICGLIRWMRSVSSEKIEVGVLVLGRYHDCAALHFIDNGEASRSSMPVVLLKDSPYRGSKEWLLTADKVEPGDDSVRLVTSEGTRELEALKPALQTRHVVCHSRAQIENIAEPHAEQRVAETA